MTTEETDKLRSIRKQLCEMELGEVKTIGAHEVIRESRNLASFRIGELVLDLGAAEQLLYSAVTR